jgi:predicted TIM-barrel fold metal-dependent hydrolase
MEARSALALNRILSADSHVFEPPELWLERIDPGFRERAPRLERGPDGDTYVCEGIVKAPIGAHRKRESPESRPRFEDVIRPGAYDPHKRMDDQALDGLTGEVVYPTVSLEMFGMPDPLLRRAVFRAYNGWIADYCRVYPDRLKGIGVVDTEDVGEGIAELRRVKELGLVGAMISVSPLDNIYVRPEFDPFWNAAVDLDLPISLHSGTDSKNQPFMTKTVGMLATISVSVQITLVDLVYGGVFARHPKLRVLSVENGVGWAPYMMQAMDVRVFLGPSRNLEFGNEALRPSDYIRRNVRFTFMSDKLGIRLRDVIGVENLLWASDYPHTESTFPNSRQTLARQLEDVPDPDREAIISGNTVHLYGFH